MRALITLMAVLGLAATASAADLEKIDRTIRKLHTLHSATPRYCLLVFGPEAKTHIWVVADDKRLFIDLNANGDLTDEGEMFRNENRYFNIGQIKELDGKTTHTGLHISVGTSNAEITIRIHGRMVQRVFRDARGRLAFGDSPKTAPIVHLNGPVTMDAFWIQKPLTSTREQRLSVVVGTPGVGPGTFAIYPCDCFLTGGAAPVADIEFPHRDPTQPPIHVQVELNED